MNSIIQMLRKLLLHRGSLQPKSDPALPWSKGPTCHLHTQDTKAKAHDSYFLPLLLTTPPSMTDIFTILTLLSDLFAPGLGYSSSVQREEEDPIQRKHSLHSHIWQDLCFPATITALSHLPSLLVDTLSEKCPCLAHRPPSNPTEQPFSDWNVSQFTQDPERVKPVDKA